MGRATLDDVGDVLVEQHVMRAGHGAHPTRVGPRTMLEIPKNIITGLARAITGGDGRAEAAEKAAATRKRQGAAPPAPPPPAPAARQPPPGGRPAPAEGG